MVRSTVYLQTLALLLCAGCAGSPPGQLPSPKPDLWRMKSPASGAGPAQVVARSAQGPQEDTPGALWVVFDRPMDPMTRLETDPPLPGQQLWIGPRTLVLLPQAPLRASSLYTAWIPEGSRDQEGQALPRDILWTFSTPRPRLLEVDPPLEAPLAEPDQAFTLTWDQPIDLDSLHERLGLAQRREKQLAVPFDLQYVRDERGQPRLHQARVTPRRRLPPQSTVLLTVQAGVRGTQGRLSGERAYKHTAHTLAPLRLEGLGCAAWPACDPTEPIHLRGSASLSPEAARQLTLSPPVPDLRVEPGAHGLTLWGSLSPHTRYRVELPARATDAWGRSLPSAWSRSFQTGEASPPPTLEPAQGRARHLPAGSALHAASVPWSELPRLWSDPGQAAGTPVVWRRALPQPTGSFPLPQLPPGTWLWTAQPPRGPALALVAPAGPRRVSWHSDGQQAWIWLRGPGCQDQPVELRDAQGRPLWSGRTDPRCLAQAPRLDPGHQQGAPWFLTAGPREAYTFAVLPRDALGPALDKARGELWLPGASHEPGGALYLAGWLRSPQGEVALSLEDPHGRQEEAWRGPLGPQGQLSAALRLPEDAPEGPWRLIAHPSQRAPHPEDLSTALWVGSAPPAPQDSQPAGAPRLALRLEQHLAQPGQRLLVHLWAERADGASLSHLPAQVLLEQRTPEGWRQRSACQVKTAPQPVSCAFTPSDPGAYRVRALSPERPELLAQEEALYVPSAASPQVAAPGDALLLPAQGTPRPGEPWELLLRSPWPQSDYLVWWQAGEQQQALTFSQAPPEQPASLRIPAALAGEALRVTVVVAPSGGGEPMRQTRVFSLPPDARALQLRAQPPGDQGALQVQLWQGEAPARGAVSVAASSQEGRLELWRPHLPTDEHGVVRLSLPRHRGAWRVQLRARGEQGEQARHSLALPARGSQEAGQGEPREASPVGQGGALVQGLVQGGQRLELPSWVPPGARALGWELALDEAPWLDAPALLEQLEGAPERPDLIWRSGAVLALATLQDPQIQQRLRPEQRQSAQVMLAQALEALLALQLPEGGFALWPQQEVPDLEGSLWASWALEASQGQHDARAAQALRRARQHGELLVQRGQMPLTGQRPTPDQRALALAVLALHSPDRASVQRDLEPLRAQLDALRPESRALLAWAWSRRARRDPSQVPLRALLGSLEAQARRHQDQATLHRPDPEARRSPMRTDALALWALAALAPDLNTSRQLFQRLLRAPVPQEPLDAGLRLMALRSWHQSRPLPRGALTARLWRQGRAWGEPGLLATGWRLGGQEAPVEWSVVPGQGEQLYLRAQVRWEAEPAPAEPVGGALRWELPGELRPGQDARAWVWLSLPPTGGRAALWLPEHEGLDLEPQPEAQGPLPAPRVVAVQRAGRGRWITLESTSPGPQALALRLRARRAGLARLPPARLWSPTAEGEARSQSATVRVIEP